MFLSLMGMKIVMVRLLVAVLVGTLGVSCSTRHASHEERNHALKVGGVILGAVAVGALAYSVAKDHGHRRGYHDSYKRDRYYGRGHGSHGSKHHSYKDRGRNSYGHYDRRVRRHR